MQVAVGTQDIPPFAKQVGQMRQCSILSHTVFQVVDDRTCQHLHLFVGLSSHAVYLGQIVERVGELCAADMFLQRQQHAFGAVYLVFHNHLVGQYDAAAQGVALDVQDGVAIERCPAKGLRVVEPDIVQVVGLPAVNGSADVHVFCIFLFSQAGNINGFQLSFGSLIVTHKGEGEGPSAVGIIEHTGVGPLSGQLNHLVHIAQCRIGLEIGVGEMDFPVHAHVLGYWQCRNHPLEAVYDVLSCLQKGLLAGNHLVQLAQLTVECKGLIASVCIQALAEVPVVIGNPGKQDETSGHKQQHDGLDGILERETFAHGFVSINWYFCGQR